MSNGKIVLDDSAVEFLQEEVGGGGTEVIANPELSGDEPNLEGLQVGETKYKVPQGGGVGIRYIQLTFELVDDVLTATLTQEQLDLLYDNAFIETEIDEQPVIFYPQDIGVLYGASPILKFSLSGEQLQFNLLEINENQNSITATVNQIYVKVSSTPQQE